MTSFQDCGFCVMKDVVYSYTITQLQQSRDWDYYSELLNGIGMGRAWQLWNGVQDARSREEEGQGSSSLLVPLGRAGIMPGAW